MQSTISGDFCKGLRSQFLPKFSDNVTSFTWRLLTLVGVNADCSSDVGVTLICYHAACTRSNVRPATYRPRPVRLTVHVSMS